jgi:hypothetical protein
VDPADALALLLSPAGRVDPYPTYEQLRAHGPIVAAGPDFYLVTGYDEADAVLRDTRFGVLDDDLRDRFMPGWRESPAVLSISRSMLRTNPPDHSRMRRLAAAAFTPRRTGPGSPCAGTPPCRSPSVTVPCRSPIAVRRPGPRGRLRRLVRHHSSHRRSHPA